MNKTIWNTNLFFQILELCLAFFLCSIITEKNIANGLLITFLVIFFIHQLIYAIYNIGGSFDSYDYEGCLETHLWFLYVFVPFVTFYDTYEEAFDKKPNILNAFVKNKNTVVDIDHKKVSVKKEKEGWSVLLDGHSEVLIILDDTHSPELLEALKIAVNENMIQL